MFSSSFEAFLTVQCIMLIAALGHYIPMSMRQLDVGIAAYMALGAYVSAILTRDFELAFPGALAAGAIAGAAGAVFIDSLATRVRLSGFAYAIFSLSFAESLRIILNNNSYVGGTLGLTGIPAYTTLGLSAGLLVVVIIGFVVLDRSRLGQVRTAIADDEFVVSQFGVRLVATKLVLFGIGGGLGGLAGALFAHYTQFVRPDDFGFELLIAIQLPVVFGGLDRFYGAILGVLLLGSIPELTRDLGQFRLLISAAATLALLIWRPSGLLSNETVAAVLNASKRAVRAIAGHASPSRKAKVS